MTLPIAHRPQGRPLGPDVPGDDVLLEAVRDGASEAFATLRERYRGTALAVARARTSDEQQAEDVASAALDRIGQIVGEGYGPHAFLGAFVVWMTGREADGGTGPIALPGDRADPASLLRAFTRLPAEWQAFLWYTEVQGRSARRTAAALGLSPVAVAPLQRDVFTGLRRAYRQEDPALGANADCERCRGDLPGLVRSALPPQRRREVQQHLDGCTACTAEYLCLQDPGTGLRSWVLPVLAGLPLWGAEAAALAGLIREADDAVEEDLQEVAASWLGHRAKSLLGAGALVAAVAVAAVGLASTGDPGQEPGRILAEGAVPAGKDPAGIPAGEAARAAEDRAGAPAGKDSVPGAAGSDAVAKSGSTSVDEELSGLGEAAHARDRGAAAPSRDDGWGPGEAAAGVVRTGPQVGAVGTEWAAVVPVAGSVPRASDGQEYSHAAGSVLTGPEAPPAGSADADAGLLNTAPGDSGRATAERPGARTPAPGPSASSASASPSPVPSVGASLPTVLVVEPAPTVTAPARAWVPPSTSASTQETRPVDQRRTDRWTYVPVAQGGGSAEQRSRAWNWSEGRSGQRDAHRDGGHEYHGLSEGGRGGQRDGHRDGGHERHGPSDWGRGNH